MSSELDSISSQLNNIDLASVETAYPLLKAGLVTAQIGAVMEERDEEDKPPYVLVKYTLTQPWETTPFEGRPVKTISPGFPLSERIYVQPWTDPKTNEVKNFGIIRLAQLREAVFGPATAGTHMSLPELMGQSITLKLKFDPAPKNKKTNETYGPQTTVDGYVRKAK